MCKYLEKHENVKFDEAPEPVSTWPLWVAFIVAGIICAVTIHMGWDAAFVKLFK